MALLGFVFALTGFAAENATNKDAAAIEAWLKLFPKCESWETKLKSGALPLLDVDSMPGTAWLPDPLLFTNGRQVRNAADWPARRLELLKLFEYYTTGVMPPKPTSMRVADLRETRDGLVTRRKFALEFGPDFKARVRVELIIPQGRGPFPVFLTQDNHRAWALVAVSRGYIGCVYAGSDSQDDTPTLSALWPDSDASLLTRRAWAASRCIDYLLTLSEVNPAQIAIAGHSRNGKQALIAGAFDERIAAVISSSSGAGGSIPARLGSEVNFSENIERGTTRYPQWYHPRLRFFAGRENKFPIDQHELISCLAPRACLLSTGINDGVESVWAIEHAWREGRRAHALFGREDAVQLRYRPGGHETNANDIEGYVDWLDGIFKRGPALTPSAPIYPTYADWLRLSGEKIDPLSFPTHPANQPLATTASEWSAKKQSIRKHIAWMLGDPIPLGPGRNDGYGSEQKWWHAMLNRDYVPDDVENIAFNFGNYIPGEIYRPKNSGNKPASISTPAPATASAQKKLPAIIWLQTHSVPFGFVPAQARIGRRFHFDWVHAGFAVLAFDQIGQGRRIMEVQRFYERHPHASLLGRTLQDVRAAVDALRQQDFIDPDRIYVVGYANGGNLALHAAALDERIAGVIAVAGFTPMRTNTFDKGTGGIARWSHWLPLMPRLGAFVGNENRIPYDYDEVLGLIAPRPVVLVQPTIDYLSSATDIRACVAAAKKIYVLENKPAALRLIEIEDYNHYSPKIAAEVVRELKLLATP